ncbi:MAG: replication-relaxation family protein [Oscillospiraceae bacterium]|nr:replication-relaxation family protein [Oscillospiraceae bacterium]
MANFKPDEIMIAGMTPADKAALLAVYQHRCLSKDLLSKYLYGPAGLPGEIACHKIDAMLLDGLLEPVRYGEGEKLEAFFLTTLGVKTVESIYGNELFQMYKRGKANVRLPGYASLIMTPTNINHQMHLNQFGLEFESYTKGLSPYRYYDEKFMPPASDFMMPDGMIELPDRLLFLEMDMGTESSGRLAQKWNSYRMFLNDPKGFYQGRPVTMLFLIEGVKNPRLRQQNTMRVLMRHLGNRVRDGFEAYFDTPENCHRIIQTKFLSADTPMKAERERILKMLQDIHGFIVSRPSFLKQIDLADGFYISSK